MMDKVWIVSTRRGERFIGSTNLACIAHENGMNEIQVLNAFLLANDVPLNLRREFRAELMHVQRKENL
jgi:hypothetical protein